MLKVFKSVKRTSPARRKRSDKENIRGNSCNPSFIVNHVEPQMKHIKTKRKILTALLSSNLRSRIKFDNLFLNNVLF